ncbi:HAMP domain-containing protein [Formicincola oecophyllae]|uniref:histidine kinase n=1 Tax=Formicincola oecophyllae TaxID=2558361 RepID=A0A4Y6UCU5_9PROT|nr:ATP-binding protein [Formicincola oecophyllae]QDH14398.1 HAMP domain-containing protein [Formicincola oecophyllae]
MVIALCLAFLTFALLAGGMGMALGHNSLILALMFLLDLLALILVVLAGWRQIGRLQAERRMGLAGARLHTRLVALFGVVAVAPTIIVGLLAALFFHFGVEIWFSNRVDSALTEAREVAVGYLHEHNANTRTEAFALANTLLTVENDEFAQGADLFHAPSRLQVLLDNEVLERGLSDAVVFDPLTERVVASAGFLSGRNAPPNTPQAEPELPPRSMVEMARAGDVAVLDQPEDRVVRAVVSLGGNSGLMLAITQPVDPEILRHVHTTSAIVAGYKHLLAHRRETQAVFVGIFALMGLLVLGVGMLIGLRLANRIARPLSLLILAARRVSHGDLAVRVPVPQNGGRHGAGREGAGPAPHERDDEVAVLSRAFNRMTDQLESQRGALVTANRQLDERRRFTETVLSGVSAGVIGLDCHQIIELPNRTASAILQRNLDDCIGKPLAEVVPEFAPLLAAAQQDPTREHTAEVQIDAEGAAAPGGPGDGGGAGAGRTLLVRVAGEFGADQLPTQLTRGAQHEVQPAKAVGRGPVPAGYVVTFDDITALQMAQRKAAWADVARRIAHEIRNPLTPIQLAAERLRRRFQKEISSDPETYSQLVETIIRQVGDIGRMVDEFSAFARMPQPEMAPHDLARLCREALVLQRHAHPEITFETSGLDGPKLTALCDRRLITQALTNLLQNAADAIDMAGRPAGVDGTRGTIALTLQRDGHDGVITVMDDGIGLPSAERHRLVEPYVTHKEKGTGLGLAIVRKIMDAHGGGLKLADAVWEQPTPAEQIGPAHDSKAPPGTQLGSGVARGTLVSLRLPLAEQQGGTTGNQGLERSKT